MLLVRSLNKAKSSRHASVGARRSVEEWVFFLIQRYDGWICWPPSKDEGIPGTIIAPFKACVYI